MNMMIAKPMSIHYEARPNVCKGAISAWLYVVAKALQDWKNKHSQWSYLPSTQPRGFIQIKSSFDISVVQFCRKRVRHAYEYDDWSATWIRWALDPRLVTTRLLTSSNLPQQYLYFNICHNNICHNNICTSINMTSKVWLTFDQKQIWPEWSLPSVENSWHLSPTKGSDKSSRPHDGHDREGYRRGNLPIIVSSKQQDVTPPDSLVLLGWENCFVGFSDQRE